MSKYIFQFLMTSFLFLASCSSPKNSDGDLRAKTIDLQKLSIEFDTQKIIVSAEKYLDKEPITITAFKADRSA